jgi:DnaK suppressor protein
MIENKGMNALTKSQRATLKQKLIELRSELTGMLTDSLESSRPVGLDQPIGRLSRMDALQQQSMTQASRRAAEMRISKIDNALHRMSKDEFGYCLECEEEIGYARLQANPETPFCLDCQSLKEKK